MKKLFFIPIALLILAGSGCEGQVQNAQRDKELQIIEAQKKKEQEVLQYQQDLKVQEERNKQATLDNCLDAAMNVRRERRNLAFAFVGLNYGPAGPPTDSTQFMRDMEAACQRKFSHSASFCLGILNPSLDEDKVEYEKAETNCYARFR